ncbi:MAG: DNA polymerase III subunit alpha [Myxococcales bacterium]|nr:DNA polymerase III subunit alpha [Myxococcales bacterium]
MSPPHGFAEVHCRSYYSFLGAASSPEALVRRAHALGYNALCLTDVDGVQGVVQAHQTARELGFSLGIGTELTIRNDLVPLGATAAAHRIVLLAQTAEGYKNLCRLTTLGRTRCAKGQAWVDWQEVCEKHQGLLLLTGGIGGPIDAAWRRNELHAAFEWAQRFRRVFGDRAYLEINHHFAPGDDDRMRDLLQLAKTSKLPPVFSQNARFSEPSMRRLYDVQSCIREKTTLQNAGQLLQINAQSYLRERSQLYTDYRKLAPAIARSVEITDRLDFSLADISYRFPRFDLKPEQTPFGALAELTTQGVVERYSPITSNVRAQIDYELALIKKLKLAGYFLIVHDIVRFCRERKILCQGRGSAANSAVCYALGITAVDPVAMDLLFERFLSEERDEMPDIDLDIDARRREEVIQYVYRRFGKEQVAMACNINSYHARSAIRDVGKVFGLSLEQVDKAAKAMDRHVTDLSPQGVVTNHMYQGVPKTDATPTAKETEFHLNEWRILTGLDMGDPVVRQVFEIARAFEGLPRHMGIHSGGIVITAGPTNEIVPVENATMAQRTVVQWDKDDLNFMGIIKIDLLGLGMLNALSDTLGQLQRFCGIVLDLAKLPMNDPGVFNMICEADTVGVFQIESRAQMNMLPRLRPRTFYDLVIEVAIIRPGPIQGDMVHPYLRRRVGDEAVTYEHPALEPVLRRTLGIPLFQEQGMKLAIACAGFSPGEADELRRAMGHKRSHARMQELQARLVDGMQENGISEDLASRIFNQLCAFADYGFPESHAASFALIVYASCYLKHHHPAATLAGLLNAQPMGFYSANTLIADARRHGVAVHAPCAQRSEWATTLEVADTSTEPVVRLGIKTLRGISEKHRESYEAEREYAKFSSIPDFAARSGVPRSVLARLATAGGFACFGFGRREALWQVTSLPSNFGSLPLLDSLHTEISEPPPPLPAMSGSDEVRADFSALGASLDSHPLAVVRPLLTGANMPDAKTLRTSIASGQHIMMGGMVIARQRPGSARGMLFMTIEDETGLANLVVTPPIFSRYRSIARQELFILARGKVERQGQVVNLIVDHLEPLPMLKQAPGPPSRDFR